ncbi:hypothetical protein [Ruminiclostridium cellobioparum]|uniref:Uncharacterized protein n=1 Tax=Ruminiclostridium cellobioparum subsp. termitidis CT1112 TaxID=1195236 RepID=S0FQ69_RUMCE|nr:hypothetical protein [Ruminiclostridium cellobioparum]EMS74007.1 hypothetical protein CTER_5135 [Ruminiclostridium cellobioparum subsp. termitidis CT1112]
MIDYKDVHSALQKLKEINIEYDDSLFTKDEIIALVDTLEGALGIWIPTNEEMIEYESNIELAKEYIKSINTTDLIPELHKKCKEYIEKYHPDD